MPASTRGKSASEDDISLKSLDTKLNLIISQLSIINSRVECLETVTKEHEKSLEYVQQELSDTRKEIGSLTKDVTESKLTMENFSNLSTRIAAYEHSSRAKCIELNGIPFQKGENLHEGLEKIVKSLNLNWLRPGIDIDNVYRIKQSKRVVVKFIQTTKRDAFFQHYRKNILSVDALGFNGKEKIFVNEVLSPEQSKLFWKTRKFKSDHNFKFVWTFNQKIYLRKTTDSVAVAVNSENDLNSIELDS